MPRLIAACAVFAAMATWEDATRASFDRCSIQDHADTLAPLPPSSEPGYVFASDGAPSTADLAGTWPGSLMMTDFSTPYGPAKGPLKAQVGQKKKLTVALEPAGPGKVNATFTTNSPQRFTMTYTGGRLSGGFTQSG